MGVLRTAAIGVLALLLLTTAAAGTVVVAAHQTVLDGTYVSNTLETEGGYDLVADRVAEQIPTEGGGDELPINASVVLEGAVTESYVATQANANIDRFYGYLHGERADPGLRLNTTPVKENAADAVESELRDREPHELLALAGGSAVGDAGIDPALIEGLDAGPEAYREAQAEFEATVRNRTVERLVDGAFESSSNDELLALVIEDYDPDAYSESEKEQLVADREAEIRAALRDRVRTQRREEINETVDARMDALRESATDGAAEREEGIAGAALELRTTVVRALTGAIDHDTYRENATAARDDLAVAAGELTRKRLNEMPAQIRITDRLDPEQRRTLDTAATAVQWLDRLVFVLPVVFAVLVAGVWRLSRSLRTTASVTGVSLLLSGGSVFAGATVAGSVLEARLPDGSGAGVVLSVLDGFLGSVRANALVVLGLGGMLLLVGLAKRYSRGE